MPDEDAIRRPSIREVAERAGVAISSVSRVLSHHTEASPRMREVVNAAVRDLGYRPDIGAQSMRTRKTLLIGMVVSDIGNSVLVTGIAAALRRLRRAGYSLVLMNSESLARLDADNIQSLLRRRVDGLILSLADERTPETAHILRQADVPVVLLDRDAPEGVGASRVIFDHRSGTANATRHLADLGHREIALIVGGAQRPMRERRLGAADGMAKAGGSARCLVHEGALSVTFGEEAADRILDRRTPPTAIVAGGNLIAHGALRAFRRRGIVLGRDLSFVGCDDVAFADFHHPPIAVVRRDMISIGEAAADLMLDLLDGGGFREVCLPTEFVPRPSCAVPGAAALDARGRAGAR